MIIIIGDYYWLLVAILLMVIGGYCIINYITTIGDYFINYSWIFYVIIS